MSDKKPKLVLIIDDSHYLIEPIMPSHGTAKIAWRLTKANGQTYVVSVGRFGPECECGDFVFRQASTPERECKHVRDMKSLNLI